ncbi:MAG TPA: right-handed parallel beta-helix repeat-containing protein [Chitinophagales bacterium]|nr:right-handed parallel beta-helix repeat-containing protein [Chitinophagales bacterium]HNM07626.1 right-handed parallel beta-helix repeat-containing protein [Chitinophagales bacterium]
MALINLDGANYYVSPAGNNLNSGIGIASPWKTIQFALNQANDGDVINVMAGTYTGKLTWNDGGVVGQYITLQNYNDDVVILDGSTVGNNQALMYIENKNYIKIDGLRFTNHNGNYQPVINVYGNCSHIEITNCEFYNTNCNESYAILCEGFGDDFLISGNNMHDLIGDNAVGVLFVGSGTTTAYTNIVITNNVLTNLDPAPSEAIAVNGNIDGFTIADNVLTDINNIGIVMIGGEDWVNTNDAVNQARNGVCRRNAVTAANSIYGGGFSAGVYVDGGKNIVVENNSITDSDIGLEIGCENMGFVCSGITVRNNLIYRNQKSGLGFGGYDYPATGMVTNCAFYGNTVYDNDVLNTGFGQLWIQYATNCIVENNIFFTSTTPWMINAETIDSTYEVNLDYNNYYYSGGPMAMKGFVDFTLITGYEALLSTMGDNAHFSLADPLFVNPAISDFHLQVTSPCINAGNPSYIPVDEFDMDLATRLTGGRIEMGADEQIAAPLSYLVNSIPTICHGSCDGSLELDGIYGCAPYTYQYKIGAGAWIPFDGFLSDLCAATYKVKVTDACGAFVMGNVVISEDALLTLTVTSIVNETVAGAHNGKITVQSTGGYGSKQYSINGGLTWQTAKKFSGLSAGTYTIMTKDAHNCTASVVATVLVGGRMMDEAESMVYPNPANHEIHISTNQPEMPTIIRLMDLGGKEVFFEETNGGEVLITLPESLPSGLYLLQWSNVLGLFQQQVAVASR